jgi:TldD protein
MALEGKTLNSSELGPELLADLLRAALRRGADFADVYAEQASYNGVESDDHKINSSFLQDGGVGIRVVKNHRTFYAIAASTDPAELLTLAAQVADAAEAEKDRETPVTLLEATAIDWPTFRQAPNEIDVQRKLDVVRTGEEVAWAGDNRVKQVLVSYRDSVRTIQLASSYTKEIQKKTLGLTEFAVCVFVGKDGELHVGSAGRSIYGGIECFTGDDSFEGITLRAKSRGVTQLEADEAPRGTMPVVFAPGDNGVLFHEACGHGMEADLIERGSSFAGKMGAPVASDLVTLFDDGTIPHAPGSYVFDDDGIAAQKTVLIENGILKSYMHSLVTARKFGVSPTGNGRRENYRHPPIPRMRNTYIGAGDSSPADIIAQTDRGLYAEVHGDGGQVDVVTGRFTTSIQVGWLIEKGKLTRPVRGATLSGIGMDVLKNIDMVGCDLVVANMSGRCGKGQNVPVGVGMPTLRVRSILVGGKGDAWKGAVA